MSSTQSANYWQVETIKAIRNMFDDQVDEETVAALFQENESDIERTVDAVLQHIREAEVKQKEQEQERSRIVSELELEFEEIPEEIEASQISQSQQSEVDYSQASISVKESNYSESLASSSSSSSSVLIYEEKPDFTISEMETQTEYSPEEKLVQTEELLSPDLRRFQDRIEELCLSLSEAKLAKVRVEEEKKNAMKWCVSEMESLRSTVAEKNIIILKQQEEIEMLKKMAQQPKPAQDDNKLDKFIVESKQMIVEGVQNLSHQLSENINKIQKEFKKVDEKDWVVVEKLKEFAADFRRELTELFKEPGSPFRKSPKKAIVSSPVPIRASPQAQYEEDRQLWQLEKASLESYIKELERQIKAYKETAAATAATTTTTTTELAASDISLVAYQANVSEEKAKEALYKYKGDVVNAIMELTL